MIGTDAFIGCVKLTYINLQETSVETIDAYAFYGCKSVKIVKLPPSLKTLIGVLSMNVNRLPFSTSIGTCQS